MLKKKEIYKRTQSHTHFHTSKSSTRKKTLFFKIPFFKKKILLASIRERTPLCSERDEKAPFYFKTSIQPNTYTVT